MACCWGCRKRSIGCHGKNEDGTWKCKDWGKEQEAREQDYQMRRERHLMDSYFADFRKERESKQKAHHAHKGKG